jgi:hypothetical protein
MSGRQHHHHDQLPLPWQQILDHRRLCGESACPTAAASEDDQGQGRHAYRHLKPAPPAPAVLFLRTTGLGAALGRLENAGVAVTLAWAASPCSRLFSYQGRMGLSAERLNWPWDGVWMNASPAYEGTSSARGHVGAGVLILQGTHTRPLWPGKEPRGRADHRRHAGAVPAAAGCHALVDAVART